MVEHYTTRINPDSIIKACDGLKELLLLKNKNYGNSFENTYNKRGDTALSIRMEDKLNRFDKLTSPESNSNVGDESIADTLKDLAGYALLGSILKSTETGIIKDVKSGYERLDKSVESKRLKSPFRVVHYLNTTEVEKAIREVIETFISDLHFVEMPSITFETVKNKMSELMYEYVCIATNVKLRKYKRLSQVEAFLQPILRVWVEDNGAVYGVENEQVLNQSADIEPVKTEELLIVKNAVHFKKQVGELIDTITQKYEHGELELDSLMDIITALEGINNEMDVPDECTEIEDLVANENKRNERKLYLENLSERIKINVTNVDNFIVPADVKAIVEESKINVKDGMLITYRGETYVAVSNVFYLVEKKQTLSIFKIEQIKQVASRLATVNIIEEYFGGNK